MRSMSEVFDETHTMADDVDGLERHVEVFYRDPRPADSRRLIARL